MNVHTNIENTRKGVKKGSRTSDPTIIDIK
jgi:hypothetical protein